MPIRLSVRQLLLQTVTECGVVAPSHGRSGDLVHGKP
jgi:hypothetical protein